MLPCRPLRPLALARLAGWWCLALWLAVGCLNPQPDPFPQTQDSTPNPGADRSSPTGVVPAMDGAANGAPVAPAQEPEQVSPPSASPGGNLNAGSAEEPPADAGDAGAPPQDAGADAGTGEGPLVGGG